MRVSWSSERPGEEGQVLRPAQALDLSLHYSGLGKDAHTLAGKDFHSWGGELRGRVCA